MKRPPNVIRTFFAPQPTLFFTLDVYTFHKVTHIVAQSIKEGEKSEDQRSTYLRRLDLVVRNGVSPGIMSLMAELRGERQVY